MQRYGFFSAHSELSRRYAKIIEKKLVLSSEMTKINLPVTKINLPVTKINLSVTKINLSVTKIEISVTKIRPLFL